MFLRYLLYALLVLFVLRAVGRLLGGVVQGVRGPQTAPRHPRSASAVKMTKDPVCGTFVVPGKALRLGAGGDTLWFCSERCRDEYAHRG